MKLGSGCFCVCEVRDIGHFDTLIVQSRTDNDPHVVEDAVKYIIFLVDADRLFDTALGMYDFSLVLMIAQHAQKVGNFENWIRPLTDNCVGIGSQGIFTIPSGVASPRQVLPEVQDRRPFKTI